MKFEDRHFTHLENPRKEAIAGIRRFRKFVPVEFNAFALELHRDRGEEVERVLGVCHDSPKVG